MSSKKSPDPVASSDKNELAADANNADKARVRVDSQALFQGASVIEVEHNGQIYRLQKTALNKLILTK